MGFPPNEYLHVVKMNMETKTPRKRVVFESTICQFSYFLKLKMSSSYIMNHYNLPVHWGPDRVKFSYTLCLLSGCERDEGGFTCLPCSTSCKDEACDIETSECLQCYDGYRGPDCTIGIFITLFHTSNIIVIYC